MVAPRSLASSTSWEQAEKLAALSGVAVIWHTAASGHWDVDILHAKYLVRDLKNNRLNTDVFNCTKDK